MEDNLGIQLCRPGNGVRKNRGKGGGILEGSDNRARNSGGISERGIILLKYWQAPVLNLSCPRIPLPLPISS